MTGQTRSHRTPRGAWRDRTAVVDRRRSRASSRSPMRDRRTPRSGGAPARHALDAARARSRRAIPIVQILAVVAVFIYGAITLPGLGQWHSIKVDPGARGPHRARLRRPDAADPDGRLRPRRVRLHRDRSGHRHRAAGQLPHPVPGRAAPRPSVASGLLGAIAGNVCHRYRIQPLIVTLAMGTIAVGVVQVQNGGTATGSAPAVARTRSPSRRRRRSGSASRRSSSIWIVVAILFAVFLHRTATGRRLFATGANERAAEYALVHTRRVWTLTFAFSAVAVGAGRRADRRLRGRRRPARSAIPTCSGASSR